MKNMKLSEGLIFELGLVPYGVDFDPQWPEYWYPAIRNCTIRVNELNTEAVDIYCRWGCLYSKVTWSKYLLTNRTFMSTLPRSLAENFMDAIIKEMTP